MNNSFGYDPYFSGYIYTIPDVVTTSDKNVRKIVENVEI